MDKERLIIDKFSNSFIGDDGAVVSHERGEWVYSKDLFCEGTHFLAGWLSMEEIARKAMLVNLSDAVAMNAEPKFVLLGLGLPKKRARRRYRRYIKDFPTFVTNTASLSSAATRSAAIKFCLALRLSRALEPRRSYEAARKRATWLLLRASSGRV